MCSFSSHFSRPATLVALVQEKNVLPPLYQFLSFCHLAVCKGYVGPRLREVCFWVIYHRHPGLPVCLITPGLTESQSASGPATKGGHCVFALALAPPIFPPLNSVMELLTECVFCARKLRKSDSLEK